MNGNGSPATDETRLHTGLIAWMVSKPIAANLLMILLLAGGAWTALHVQKEVFPDYQLDLVEVRVEYPGASPAEVEQGILLPIEEAIRNVQGIREMTSTAREGSGSLDIELVAGAERMKVYQEIDQAVNRIRTFPDDIESPEVRLGDDQQNVMQIGFYGEVDVWTLRKLAEDLRDRLQSHPDISQVELHRVPEYVTHVEISQERLREYHLTLNDLARTIERSSRDIPAGAVETAGGEILLRMKERKPWAGDLAAINVLSSSGGTSLTLGDLARITDGFEEAGFHSQFNQQPSVEVNVYRIGKQSPLDIARAVEEVLVDVRATLPPGVALRIDSNQAQEFKERLHLLIENGGLAIVIVLCILTVFLEFRLAFWVMMGMTTSFIGALVFLPMIGVSINMISMFAFLLVLGIVVDDAIVVGENVYEYRRAGKGPVEAAILGARDVSTPVVFSILTSVVAFVPLMFIPGTTGKFWWPLPVVVITVLLVSLVEALFILPAHLSHVRINPHRHRLGQALHRVQQGFAEWFNRIVDTYYRRFLDRCLKIRYVTLSLAASALLVVGAFGLSDHMGMIMMPQVPAHEIEAGVRLPVGATPVQAAAVAKEITDATQRMFEKYDLHLVAEGIKTNVRGGNFIDVEIVMKPPGERDMSAAEVIRLWRDEIGDIQGVNQITFEAERGPGGWRDDISVDLSHNDVGVLEAAAMAFKAEMESFESTRDVNDNFNKGKSQLDLKVLPEARILGLTPEDIGRQVRDAFHGALAFRQLRGTNEVEIRVKLPKNQREDLFHLENLVIQTSDGVDVLLLDVVEVQQGEAFTRINRRDGRRIVSVGMDVEPEGAAGRVIQTIKAEVLPQLRADFPGITWSFEGTNAEMRESTRVLWGGFALAMAVVYSLLAIAFGSYLQPLIVMVAIPFGIVGAVIGHILLGFDLSLVSLMGVIALSGVVVNDSLIMVDYANRRRGDRSAHEAIHEAGLRRFRPIMLTTVTTFGGLTPIILESSSQAAYLIPMAISLGCGIVFATAIILVIVPCLYLVLEDFQRLLKS